MREGKIHKTVIFTGYECNNRCRFCMENNRRVGASSLGTERMKREIVAARKRGANYLELIGGEMTIRPDFIYLLKFAKEVGFETVMIATNGRMFSKYPVAEKILLSGLNSLVFSIHGADKETHDYLTQAPGSFEQLTQGIKNVRKVMDKHNLILHIGSNTCIVKQNYKSLPKIGKLIRSFGISNSEFIFVDPNEGGAFNDFYKFVPEISEIAPYIKKCLDIGIKDKVYHWAIRYVPLCHFLDYIDHVSELHENRTFEVDHIAPDFSNFNVLESRRTLARQQTARCVDCLLKSKCEGIWKNYLRHYGDKELVSVKRLTKSQKKSFEAA